MGIITLHARVRLAVCQQAHLQELAAQSSLPRETISVVTQGVHERC